MCGWRGSSELHLLTSMLICLFTHAGDVDINILQWNMQFYTNDLFARSSSAPRSAPPARGPSSPPTQPLTSLVIAVEDANGEMEEKRRRSGTSYESYPALGMDEAYV